MSLSVPSSVPLLHAACLLLLDKAASCRASLLRRADWSRMRSMWRTVESFWKLSWRWGGCLGCLMRRSWWIITPAATGRAECHDRAGSTSPSTICAFTPSCWARRVWPVNHRHIFAVASLAYIWRFAARVDICHLHEPINPPNHFPVFLPPPQWPW